MFQSPGAGVKLVIIVVFTLTTVFTPMLTPRSPLLISISVGLGGPSTTCPLNASRLKQYVLSELL